MFPCGVFSFLSFFLFSHLFSFIPSLNSFFQFYPSSLISHFQFFLLNSQLHRCSITLLLSLHAESPTKPPEWLFCLTSAKHNSLFSVPAALLWFLLKFPARTYKHTHATTHKHTLTHMHGVVRGGGGGGIHVTGWRDALTVSPFSPRGPARAGSCRNKYQRVLWDASRLRDAAAKTEGGGRRKREAAVPITC